MYSISVYIYHIYRYDYTEVFQDGDTPKSSILKGSILNMFQPSASEFTVARAVAMAVGSSRGGSVHEWIGLHRYIPKKNEGIDIS